MNAHLEMIDTVEVLFAVEGHARCFSARVGPTTKVADFAAIAANLGQVREGVDVFLEDGETPLQSDVLLLDNLSARFAPLHVARPGLIRTTVRYNNRQIERPFRPSATIGRIIEWAIGKDGFSLDGTSADYQLKHQGQVLSPDQHLGQVAHGNKAVELDLVFKVKPQG